MYRKGDEKMKVKNHSKSISPWKMNAIMFYKDLVLGIPDLFKGSESLATMAMETSFLAALQEQ